jgi:uncharacterized protein (DUF1501 family)
MKRRHFLQAGLGLACLYPGMRQVWALQSALPARRKLVVVMLRGAVDGISLVVPYGDAEYYRVRESIALGRPGTEGGVLDLDGYFGLHPALAPLLPFWQSRQLAFVQASGSPDPTRSHFDAQDYMESATPGVKATQDGWMNRLLGVLPGDGSPTQGVCVGAVMPRIFSGAANVANMASGDAAGRPVELDKPALNEAFAHLYGNDKKMSEVYQQGIQAHQSVMRALEEDMRMADGGAPVPKGFPGDAVRLASLLRKNAGTQLAFVALGGWDTHVNQGAAKGALANNLAPLAEGLARLAQGLGPLLQDTQILVMSEFGRTIRQNGTGGTDHGHGNVMLLLGGEVQGGKIHGDWQGLGGEQLYEGRDLPVTTDFRSVLAQVLERHLQLPDRQLVQVIPDAPHGLKALKLFI